MSRPACATPPSTAAIGLADCAKSSGRTPTTTAPRRRVFPRRSVSRRNLDRIYTETTTRPRRRFVAECPERSRRARRACREILGLDGALPTRRDRHVFYRFETRRARNSRRRSRACPPNPREDSKKSAIASSHRPSARLALPRLFSANGSEATPPSMSTEACKSTSAARPLSILKTQRPTITERRAHGGRARGDSFNASPHNASPRTSAPTWRR